MTVPRVRGLLGGGSPGTLQLVQPWFVVPLELLLEAARLDER